MSQGSHDMADYLRAKLGILHSIFAYFLEKSLESAIDHATKGSHIRFAVALRASFGKLVRHGLDFLRGFIAKSLMQKIFRQLLAVDGPMTAFLLATRADVARIHRHNIGSSNSNMGTLSVVVIATKTVYRLNGG